MNGTVGLESGFKLIRPSPLAHSHFRAAAAAAARSWGCLEGYQSASILFCSDHFWHRYFIFNIKYQCPQDMWERVESRNRWIKNH